MHFKGALFSDDSLRPISRHIFMTGFIFFSSHLSDWPYFVVYLAWLVGYCSYCSTHLLSHFFSSSLPFSSFCDLFLTSSTYWEFEISWRNNPVTKGFEHVINAFSAIDVFYFFALGCFIHILKCLHCHWICMY